MTKLGATLLFLIGLAHSTSAIAQATGNEGKFTIYNKSDNNVVVGFYTNDGDGWSANWLEENMTPGSQMEAEFTADTGKCQQTLQVGWLGADGGEVLDDEISINICEASNVYAADNEIFYD